HRCGQRGRSTALSASRLLSVLPTTSPSATAPTVLVVSPWMQRQRVSAIVQDDSRVIRKARLHSRDQLTAHEHDWEAVCCTSAQLTSRVS
ncbi:TPA: hypothetical protein N0F65_005579, partial [Lagenidium giganteum]